MAWTSCHVAGGWVRGLLAGEGGEGPMVVRGRWLLGKELLVGKCDRGVNGPAGCGIPAWVEVSSFGDWS